MAPFYDTYWGSYSTSSATSVIPDTSDTNSGENIVWHDYRIYEYDVCTRPTATSYECITYNNTLTNCTTNSFNIRIFNSSGASSWYEWSPRTRKEKMKDIFKDRLIPEIITSRKAARMSVDNPEIRARQTLRRILGDDKYRRFIKNGFVSVHAKSGLIYQIFPGSRMTNIYDNGKVVDRLCVVLQGRFPPTDSLIMRYLLILNDEDEFRRLAIKHRAMQPKQFQIVNNLSENLLDVWNGLKAAA